MPAQDGGSVGIDILPKIDAAAWGQQIKTKLDPTLDRIGRSSGRRLGAALSEGAKAGFSVRRLEEAMRDARPRMEAAATTLGRRVGAEIARGDVLAIVRARSESSAEEAAAAIRAAYSLGGSRPARRKPVMRRVAE